MKKIDIVYFKAGGGHKATALALEAALIKKDHKVRLIDIRDMLQSIDWIYNLTGIKIENIYNFQLKNHFTLGLRSQLKIAQAIINSSSDKIVIELKKYWTHYNWPHEIVSVIPNFNRQLLIAANSYSKFSVVMSDFEDSPPNFWLEEGTDYKIFVPTYKAESQAKEMGCRGGIRTSGIVIHPKFYEERDNHHVERTKFGLDPYTPVAIVMFGGYGSSRMLKFAQMVSKSQINCQFIFVCGENETLRTKIRAVNRYVPWIITGYTDNLPELFNISDFYVGKTGPGSITEALVSGLPVMVENHHIMFQEKFALDWIKLLGFGMVVDDLTNEKNFYDIINNYQKFKKFVKMYENKGVFEVADQLTE